MNTKVTAQMLKEDTPDTVILATGAETLVLPFIKVLKIRISSMVLTAWKEHAR